MRFGSRRREYMVKIGLSILFIGVLIAFLILTGPQRLAQAFDSITITDYLLFALATYRLGRLFAFDRIMEPYRAPFARTVPDSSGAGDSVEPAGEGVRQVIGQLIS